MRYRSALILSCFGLLTSPPTVASDTDQESVELTLEAVLEKVASTSWPANYMLFSEIGVSSFRQFNRSDSLNVAFKSGGIKTKDDYEMEFIEYRVPPQLDRGISYLLIQMKPGTCFDVDILRGRFELERYTLPPNPHVQLAMSRDKVLRYRVDLGNADLLLTVAPEGECLVSVSRSFN
jgi:hypothetical protein